MFTKLNEVAIETRTTEYFPTPYLFTDAIRALEIDFPFADKVRFSFTRKFATLKVYENGEEVMILKVKATFAKEVFFDFVPKALAIDGLERINFHQTESGYVVTVTAFNEIKMYEMA